MPILPNESLGYSSQTNFNNKKVREKNHQEGRDGSMPKIRVKIHEQYGGKKLRCISNPP
jgi:hypothetical protein